MDRFVIIEKRKRNFRLMKLNDLPEYYVTTKCKTRF